MSIEMLSNSVSAVSESTEAAATQLVVGLLGADLDIVQKLDDEPNDVGGLTADQLKAKFDEGGNIIKTYINETLIPAISDTVAEAQVRAAAEEVRVANEQGRVNGEQARVSQEGQRLDNEKVRAENEVARQMAEAERTAAETARKSAEVLRGQEETARENAEQARATAEASRCAVESARANKELERQAAELDRGYGERDRVSAESSRKSAEGERAEAEELRLAAEEARKSAEEGRIQAETLRNQEETARQEAESLRREADSARSVWESFDEGKGYIPGNKVVYQGSSYQNVSACKGVYPDDESCWMLIAAKGVDGTGGSSGVADYSKYLQELYAAQIRSNLAALESAYEKNLNTLDHAQQTISPQYEQARNAAAGAAAVSQRNFNQYASAAGLNAGTGAQAQLANNVALQNNLNDVELAERSANAELELQRADLKTEYEKAIVQAQADGDYELAQALYRESVRVSEAIEEQERYLASLALQHRQYEDQLSQYDRQLARSDAETGYERGLAMAQYLYDLTGDASGFAGYGYTADQIAAMENQWKLANGSVNAAAPAYQTPDKKEAVEEVTGYSTVRNEGMKASQWDMVKQNVKLNLMAGNTDAAAEYLRQVAAGMSAAQEHEIDQLLKEYGY